VTRILTLAAALLAVLVLALGATGAPAAERPSLTDEIAARLGVSGEQLRAAVKATLTARIDAAVAAGKLTPERAATLKERIATAKGLGLGMKRGSAKKQKALVQRIAKAKGARLAAEYLGLTREELRAELKAGKSLAQIAVAEGKTAAGLVDALLVKARERATKAVAAKRVTQQQAEALLERLEERIEKRVQRTRTAS